jgi:hypothetical protein
MFYTMKNASLRLLICLSLIASACGVEKSEKDFNKFTGRWKLYIVETKADVDASWVPRQGDYKNRQGFILYDGRGGMGVHHVTENYQRYTFEGKGGLDSLTRNDLRHLANNFVYFGKYRVIDSVGIIEHHIESAHLPNLCGTVAARKYAFMGDTLVLSPVTDRYPKSRLKWVRLSDLE